MISYTKAQKYAGIFFLIFSILLYFYIIPAQVIDEGYYGMSAYILPKTYAAILGIMSIALIIKSLFDERKIKDHNLQYYEITRDEIFWIALITIVSICYVLLIEVLGYIISSFLGLFCFFLIFNEKRCKLIVMISFLLPLFIFFFFRLTLKMYLPEGIVPIPF